jgi:hypothetical protein
MSRRLALTLAALALTALAGCSYGTAATLTPAQEQARVHFIEAHDDFNDRELAQLCPGLYPRDFLTNSDDWPEGKHRSGDRTARQIAAARTRDAAQIRAAACDVRPQ